MHVSLQQLLQPCSLLASVTTGWCLVSVAAAMFGHVFPAAVSRAAHATRLVQQFTVPEEQPAGTVFGRVMGVRPPVRAYFRAGSDAERDLAVSEGDGAIVARTRLDRESLDSAQYRFEVVSAVENVTATVTVFIADINDHSPTFSESLVHLTVSEAAPLDARLRLPSAVDRDVGTNAVQGYFILSGNEDAAFRLVSGSAVGSRLELAVCTPLDHELVSQYRLQIAAVDGGSPARTGSMTVHISVADANDNRPVFDNDTYTASVREDVAVGTTIIRVHASDRDSRNNGLVRYHLDRKRCDSAGQFDVDAMSGVVFTQRPLDFEQTARHQLIIVAADQGPRALHASAVVFVQVIDVNDHAPTVRLVYLGAEDDHGQVSSHAQPGDRVARLSVSDLDRHDNVTVLLRHHRVAKQPQPLLGDLMTSQQVLAGDEAFVLTSYGEGVYVIRVARSLTELWYRLEVIAVDSGSLSTSVFVDLFVLRDVSPRFTKSLYRGTLSTDTEPGSCLTTVRLLGAGAAATTYRRLDDDQLTDVVYVGRRSGRVCTRSWLSCDSRATVVRLSVLATDWSVVPPTSAAVAVELNVTRAAASVSSVARRPSFETGFYRVNVDEDVTPGTCIVTVSSLSFTGGQQPDRL